MEPFSLYPPRLPDAELLRRSLKRPTLAAWLMTLLAAFMLWNAQLGYSMNQMGLATSTLAFATILGYGAFRYFIACHRLRAIWRSGIRTRVVLKKSLYFWTRAYRYTVKIDDGRQAVVILSAASDLGGELPALVHGDQIAVSDFGGCLKPGKLRRA